MKYVTITLILDLATFENFITLIQSIFKFNLLPFEVVFSFPGNKFQAKV